MLGIDAGGSATRSVLLENGGVTVRPAAAPMNALLTPGMADILQEIIVSASPSSAGIGMPGLRSREQASRLSAELAARTGCPVRVTDDVHIALLGAFVGQPGIVVIAGTGSGAVGWDGKRWARAGAHGFILGDEGSAYWIGRAAARAALRWRDGTGGSELMCQLVARAAGMDLDSLVREVHSHPAQRDRLARLAPAVTGLAAEDEVARRIVRNAARHLAALAAAVRDRIGPLPVAAAGGVFSSPAIWDQFAQLSGAIRPMAPAAVGAALFGGAPDEFPERGYA
jgi:glucosamine kinase